MIDQLQQALAAHTSTDADNLLEGEMLLNDQPGTVAAWLVEFAALGRDERRQVLEDARRSSTQLGSILELLMVAWESGFTAGFNEGAASVEDENADEAAMMQELNLLQNRLQMAA